MPQGLQLKPVMGLSIWMTVEVLELCRSKKASPDQPWPVRMSMSPSASKSTATNLGKKSPSEGKSSPCWLSILIADRLWRLPSRSKSMSHRPALFCTINSSLPSASQSTTAKQAGSLSVTEKFRFLNTLDDPNCSTSLPSSCRKYLIQFFFGTPHASLPSVTISSNSILPSPSRSTICGQPPSGKSKDSNSVCRRSCRLPSQLALLLGRHHVASHLK